MLHVKSGIEVNLMLSMSLLIVAAAIVYMVEAYINSYYAIEYMHGTSLFFVLLAKYVTPVIFLLMCAYIAYRRISKNREAQNKSTIEQPTNKDCLLYTSPSPRD